MQTRLSVKKHRITIGQMALNSVSDFEFICNFDSVPGMEERNFA
jgi:hypothetical protein